MRVVVYGAGAVGSVIGGLLSLERHDVLLVCREAHASAITDGGLRLRSATGDYVAHPTTATQLRREDLGDDSVVLLTVKSYAADDAVGMLAQVAPATTPVICLQNGVASEEIAAARFENVYGGVCRMTCSTLQPGHASFRRLGRVVMGKYPKGTVAALRALGRMLETTGLDVCMSRNIMSDKWLKLAVNTQSAFNAVIDPRDHDANEFFELKARILEETRQILKVSKVRARPCGGKDPTIDEMVDDLRRPRARRASRGINVHNSTWQALYRKSEAIESGFFHEPLIELAREHGADATLNETALAVVRRCHEAGAGPETMRLADVLAEVEQRKNPTT